MAKKIIIKNNKFINYEFFEQLFELINQFGNLKEERYKRAKQYKNINNDLLIMFVSEGRSWEVNS